MVKTTHSVGHAGNPSKAILGRPRALSDIETEVYVRIPSEVDYICHESFSWPGTESRYYGKDAASVAVPAWNRFPDVADEAVSASGEGRRRRLTAQEEAFLFLKYNYAKYRLCELVEAQAKAVTTPRGRKMIQWFERAMQARADLVCANLALVLAMAKRMNNSNVEFCEAVSEGNMALLRSVDKFDVSRGFKFSTYACHAILRSLSRLASRTGRRRQRFPLGYEPDMEQGDHGTDHRDEVARRDSVEAVHDLLSSNRVHLTDMEQTIVVERFALASENGQRTLSEVGKMVGLTTERVRQIQNQALSKIRGAMGEDFVAA